MTQKPCPLSAADLFDFTDLLSQRDRCGARSLRARETRRFRSHWATLREWLEDPNGDEDAQERIADRICRSKWNEGRNFAGPELYRIAWARERRQRDAERITKGPEQWHGAK